MNELDRIPKAENIGLIQGFIDCYSLCLDEQLD